MGINNKALQIDHMISVAVSNLAIKNVMVLQWTCWKPGLTGCVDDYSGAVLNLPLQNELWCIGAVCILVLQKVFRCNGEFGTRPQEVYEV